MFHILRYAIIAITIWLCVEISLPWILGIYKFADFRIGWSHDFMVSNVAIDNPWKYFLLLFYVIFSSIVKNFAFVFIFTWLISELQNPNHIQIRQTNFFIFYSIIIWNTYTWINNIFGSSGMDTSHNISFLHIDLWMIGWATTIISQIVFIAMILKQKRKTVWFEI